MLELFARHGVCVGRKEHSAKHFAQTQEFAELRAAIGEKRGIKKLECPLKRTKSLFCISILLPIRKPLYLGADRAELERERPLLPLFDNR